MFETEDLAELGLVSHRGPHGPAVGRIQSTDPFQLKEPEVPRAPQRATELGDYRAVFAGEVRPEPNVGEGEASPILPPGGKG